MCPRNFFYVLFTDHFTILQLDIIYEKSLNEKCARVRRYLFLKDEKSNLPSVFSQKASKKSKRKTCKFEKQQKNNSN